MAKRFAIVLSFILVWLLSACGPKQGHFAIYLPAENTTPAEMTQLPLERLKLSDKMLLAPDDIVAYEQNTHKLILTAEGYEKLLLQEVPMDGLPLIAAVGDQPVYPIALWTPLSSATFDGLIIMQPFEPDAREVFILTGYPTDKFFSGVDPRSQQIILDSLKADKKLR